MCQVIGFNTYPNFTVYVLRFPFLYTYSDNVYTGQVLTATCNCIPNNSTLSSSLKCQHYQINQDTGNILATVLTNGECESEGYTIKPFCSALGDSLAGICDIIIQIYTALEAIILCRE